MELKRSEKELVSVKAKHMKEPKMWEIKYNSRNKFKDIRMNNKTKKRMQAKNKKMIFKWKEISKEICIQNNSRPKEKMIKSKDNKNRQIKKWEMLTMNKDNKI